jgi:hypothetical protein
MKAKKIPQDWWLIPSIPFAAIPEFGLLQSIQPPRPDGGDP